MGEAERAAYLQEQATKSEHDQHKSKMLQKQMRRYSTAAPKAGNARFMAGGGGRGRGRGRGGGPKRRGSTAAENLQLE